MAIVSTDRLSRLAALFSPVADRLRSLAALAGRAAVVGALALAGTGCSKSNPTQPAPAKEAHITFYTGRDGNYEIYVMNTDGTGQTNLTNNAASDQLPAWSPDGSKVAFESTRDDGSTSEIYVMNADGSGQTRLTNNSANDYWPTWSPDGTKIALVSSRDGNAEIDGMNEAGSGRTSPTNNCA